MLSGLAIASGGCKSWRAPDPGPPILGVLPAGCLTDSAVIALAEYPKQVTVIREGLTTRRSTCGLDGSRPSIVHTTLFRYAAALRNPTALLEAAQCIRVAAWFPVQDLRSKPGRQHRPRRRARSTVEVDTT
jgi:hypothetical protein